MANAKGRNARVPPEPVLRQLRIPMIHKAVLTYRGQREDVYVIDVAIAGVFIERKQALAIDEKVEIEFRVPGNELGIRAGCRVAWCHQKGAPLKTKTLPAGIGLQFVEIAEADLARIREHVVAYCRRHPKTRQFHPSWPEEELAGRLLPAD